MSKTEAHKPLEWLDCILTELDAHRTAQVLLEGHVPPASIAGRIKTVGPKVGALMKLMRKEIDDLMPQWGDAEYFAFQLNAGQPHPEEEGQKVRQFIQQALDAARKSWGELQQEQREVLGCLARMYNGMSYVRRYLEWAVHAPQMQPVVVKEYKIDS